MRERLRLLAPWLWIAYIVIPVAGWGLLDGRPLGLPETSALAAVLWLWGSNHRLGLAPVVGAALVAKLALGLPLLAPHGFEARYYANGSFDPPVERSIEGGGPGVTRIDERLRFGEDGAPDLPVHFFNEVKRFNFYAATDPDRRWLPVSVAWSGTLRVTDAGRQRFYVRTPAGTVTMSIGSALTAQIPPSNREWTREADLTVGDHRVSITLAIPQGDPRVFEAGRVVAGRERPFDSTVILRRSVPTVALATDRILRILSSAVDVVLCAWLAFALAAGLRDSWRRLWPSFPVGDVLAVLSALAIFDALVWALPVLERMTTLSGGDDWLTYETQARDIALNGVWMAAGAPLGHGAPFYYQPLYPYFVAACHLVFGDDLFGVYFVQRLLLAATVLALWRTTAVLFDERVGAAGLVTATVIVYEKLGRWAGVLLSEVLFIALVCMWTYLLVRLALRHRGSGRAAEVRPAQAVAAGVLGGLATLTRSTLVLGWLVALPALTFALKRARWMTLTLIVTTMVTVTSLATLRNWVVARAFVPIASSGSVNLYLGNSPPMRLKTAPKDKVVYERLGFDVFTQMVADYIRQQPRAFLAGLAQKATYTLGWFDTMLPGFGRSNFYVITWATALVGVLLAGRAMPSGSGWAVAIPMTLALAHFATVVIIFPHVYGDRLILPFYALLAPYVGVAVFAAYRRVARAGGGPGLIWMGGLTACLWAAFTGASAFDASMVVVVALLGILCLAGPLDVSWRHVWLCVAFALVLAWWYWVERTPDVQVSVRAGWLFLAGALWAGILVRRSRELRAYVAVLGAGCALVSAWLIVRVGPAASWSSVAHTFALTPTYHEAAVACAWVGLGLILTLTVARKWPRPVVSTGGYLAGIALGVAALDVVNGTGSFSWKLVRDTYNAFGSVGTASYLLVWIWGAWPIRVSGDTSTVLAFRLLQGLVVALFIGAQAGVALDGNGSAMLMAASLLIGAAQAFRHPAQPRWRAVDTPHSPSPAAHAIG